MNPNHAHKDPGEDGQPAPRPAAKAALLRALVVDGDRFMSVALERSLEAHGYAVVTADSAASALDRTRALQPDLILLDSGVDASKSMELLGELLIEQACAAVVVVARTPSIAEAVSVIKIGALDYLERPLDMKRFEELLETQQAWRVDAPSPA